MRSNPAVNRFPPRALHLARGDLQKPEERMRIKMLIGLIFASLGAQLLGISCAAWYNDLTTKVIGFILLLPGSLFLILMNKAFGESFSKYVVQSTMLEAVAVITFFSINVFFWVAVAQLLRHWNAIKKQTNQPDKQRDRQNVF
jgi:hypothetical protein